jgi:Flp pilus assembly protein TadB
MSRARSSRQTASRGSTLGWALMALLGVLLLGTVVVLYVQTELFAWSLLVALGVVALAVLTPVLEAARRG